MGHDNSGWLDRDMTAIKQSDALPNFRGKVFEIRFRVYRGWSVIDSQLVDEKREKVVEGQRGNMNATSSWFAAGRSRFPNYFMKPRTEVLRCADIKGALRQKGDVADPHRLFFFLYRKGNEEEKYLLEVQFYVIDYAKLWYDRKKAEAAAKLKEEQPWLK